MPPLASADATRAMRELKARLSTLDKDAKRAVTKGFNEAVLPMRQTFQAEAATLPSSGGFAKYIGKASFAVARRLGGARPSITVKVRRSKKTGAVDLRAVNRGRLRRRTFGHRPWVTQSVRPGVWDRTTEQAGQDAAEAVLHYLKKTAAG